MMVTLSYTVCIGSLRELQPRAFPDPTHVTAGESSTTRRTEFPPKYICDISRVCSSREQTSSNPDGGYINSEAGAG
jgi:hypothetical protein